MNFRDNGISGTSWFRAGFNETPFLLAQRRWKVGVKKEEMNRVGEYGKG